MEGASIQNLPSVTEPSASPAVAAALMSLEDRPGPAPFRWPLSSMRREVFRKGECLFKQGDKADRMFYLHRGAVWLPEIKKTITSGQLIGELGLFSPRSERTASAICKEDLEAYSIGRQEALEFFRRDPSLAIDLIQITFTRFIENQRAELEARERMESELRIARDIQMSMLPQQLPSAALRQEVLVGATMRPAKQVGGDFYDYFMVGDHKLCVVIGDASGKGVPAALFVAVGKALLKSEAVRGSHPHQIVGRVNRLLCPDNALCMFITLLCFTLDTQTGAVECCNAGHESPVVCRADGSVERTELPAGMAIGVMPEARYRSRKLRLQAGDTLFAYTDGVTEAINPQQKCFSQKRLLQSLARHGRTGVPELLEAVRQDLDAYRASEPQSDDITCAAVRFLGPVARSRAAVRSTKSSK